MVDYASPNPNKESMSEEENQKNLQLLEEKVEVNRRKEKVGEVVVSKQVETKTVEVSVPVKQEKLIVEQIDSNGSKQLAEVELAQEKITGVEKESSVNYAEYIVAGEFISPRVARDALAAIHNGCAKIRLEIVVENRELQQIYQEIFDGCTNS